MGEHAMKRHVDTSPLDRPADFCPTRLRKSLLVLAGAAVVLIGCTQDEVGKAPGGLEPSASSQRSERPDNTDSSGGSGSQGDGSEESGGGSGSSGSGGGSGGAS
jgi:hypothetical protein